MRTLIEFEGIQLMWVLLIAKSNHSTEELKSFLRKNLEGTSELLKIISHVNRLQILTLLLDEEHKSFLDLLNEVNISRTALANHLGQLMDKNLIQRIERGNYQITRNGRMILNITANLYDVSNRWETKRVKEHYLSGFKASGEFYTIKKLVPNEPELQTSAFTYLGAISGVLKALGTDLDVTTIGAYSGFAFLVNIGQDRVRASSIYAHKAWSEFHQGIQSLGWQITEIGDDIGFPESEGPLTPRDSQRARELFERIKAEIDENNQPVVLWGIPLPEFGIVKGYTQDSYVVSTFRRDYGQPDPPIRYDALFADCGLRALFFRKKSPDTSKQADKSLILRAISMAEGTSYPLFGFIAGPVAFDIWASILGSNIDDTVTYHGNSYVGNYIHEAKDIAASFLLKLAEKHTKSPQQTPLAEAAQEYRAAEKLMKQFKEIFPLNWYGDMSRSKCQRGAELLRNVKHHELRALDLLRYSIEMWD
ncbi:MAG: winged helix-turn-helix domain-containing protein [Candidatus Hodarchaeota archaeon]